VPELLAARGTPPPLAAEGLGYAYPGAPRLALDGVTLEIAAGEFTVLAGRSASGKTTLLRAACGLVPHFHGGELAGEVRVGGLDTAASGPGELAPAVGYVAQDPESQVVSTTVAAEIELPLELRGESAVARARAVEEVALALAIPHLLGRTVDTLSGGELQRVALAAALVTRPPLVLLDEPTSQLDPVAGDELIWLLRRLNAEWGVAVLLAEHRLERCLAAADRVIAIDAGAIAFDGPPREFLGWALAADPALATPAARLFSLAGIAPLPVGVRDAKEILAACDPPAPRPGPPPARAPAPRSPEPALRARDLWVELDRGEELRDVLRGVEVEVGASERIALMGRNGAGKSTFLRAAAGLVAPAAGKLEAPRGVALLTQSPGDFVVRERVAEELPGEAGRAALAAVGLEDSSERDPRDLSGGERQRLALAVTLAGRTGGGELPGVVALDEPTRGMDRARKQDLVALIGGLAESGAAVIVATHDVEFAAAFAERVLLLGEGEVIADGSAQEVLAGGWYFATEVARILDAPGLVTPEQGAALLRAGR
jgi:energy-coupling factor transport system ATP-binding protein